MTAATIFHIGPIALTFTGIMCALGLTLMIALSSSIRSFTKSVLKKRLSAYFVFAIPAALILARAAYCLCSPENFSGRYLSIFALHAGGYSFMVAAAGFALAALAYAHVYDLDKRKLLDILVPGLLTFIAFIRLSEISPAQSTGHVVTAKFLRSTILTVNDRYGITRHAVSLCECFAAAAMLIPYSARFITNRRQKTEDAPGEAFAFAAVALCALNLPIEALRDGAYPAILGISLDMIVCGASIIAIAIVSAVRLWKLAAKQYVLVRTIPAVLLVLTALLLSLRAPKVASPELNSFWILLCALVSAFLTYSLRAACIRRTRGKEVPFKPTSFVVRIPAKQENSTKPADVDLNAETDEGEADDVSVSPFVMRIPPRNKKVENEESVSLRPALGEAPDEDTETGDESDAE